MRTKFLLFAGGSLLAVGGFATYAFLTGADLRHRAAPVVDPSVRIDETADISNPTFEFRSKLDMRLEYLITAQTARPLGKGRYDLVEPRGSFYDKDGTLTVIAAEAGTIQIEQFCCGCMA